VFKWILKLLWSNKRLYDATAMPDQEDTPVVQPIENPVEELDRLLLEAGVTNFTAKELTWLPKALPNPKSEVPSGQFLRNLIAVAKVAQEIRTELGAPLSVSSAYRPRWYNSAVGGAPNSAHLRAAAIDLNAQTSDDGLRLKSIAEKLWKANRFAGMGFYRNVPRRIHIDVIHPDGKGHRRWTK
jgi:uncharacterized protein YcbK (DUF882 family)